MPNNWVRRFNNMKRDDLGQPTGKKLRNKNIARVFYSKRKGE